MMMSTAKLLLGVLGSVLLIAACSSSKPAQQADSQPVSTYGSTDALPQVPRHGPKKRIGILDFEDSSSGGGRGYYSRRGSDISNAAREVVTEMLVKSGHFVVIERDRIAQVLNEQKLGQTGAISTQSAVQAGKLLGLQALLVGKITDYNLKNERGGFGGFVSTNTQSVHVRVSLRFVDASTGEVWAAESGEGSADTKSTMVMGGGSSTQDGTIGKKALYGAIRQMLGKLLTKADGKPWSSQVVKVDDSKKVYISGGSDIGLEPGTAMLVRRLGEEIKDPESGQVLGRAMGPTLGTIQLAEHLNEKLSVCVPTKGSDFQIGDLVVLDQSAPPAQ
jgi:curli biogenesis system outer membrane secretion channel CsgG